MNGTRHDSAEPAQFEEFRDAEAAFRQRQSSESQAGLIAAAVGLLVAGVESPNLAVLAGEDSADPYEVASCLEATLRDLGLPPLDDGSVATRTISRITEQVLEGSMAARDGAAAICDAWLPASDSLGPDLSHLATIADYLDHGWETWGPSTDVFLEALRRYRAGERVHLWDLVTREFARDA